MLKEESLDPELSLFAGSLSNEPVQLDNPLMKEGYDADPFPNQVLNMLKDKVQQSKKNLLGESNNNNDLSEY